MTNQVAGGPEFLVVSPWWVDEMARAARHAEIDRMARAVRRHIRYERVKALQMVVRFRFKPITLDYSQRVANAFWRRGLDEIGFGSIVTRDYTDALNAQMRSTVVVRFPNRAAN